MDITKPLSLNFQKLAEEFDESLIKKDKAEERRFVAYEICKAIAKGILDVTNTTRGQIMPGTETVLDWWTSSLVNWHFKNTKEYSGTNNLEECLKKYYKVGLNAAWKKLGNGKQVFLPTLVSYVENMIHS